jgi:HEAT repeat protein
MRYPALLILMVSLSGCSGGAPTPQAGGKPVEHWLAALLNPDAKLRKTAVLKLGNVGNSDARALPAVIGALKDADVAVRSEAIRGLLKFGPDARQAEAALLDIERHGEDERIRAVAKKMLAKLADWK